MTTRLNRVPVPALFAVSAIFHYLGPACASLLFGQLGVAGVAWLRIASAAAVFAIWRRPWRLLVDLDSSGRRTLLALGAVLAGMNTVFYLAVQRLPLSTVGAVEFLGTVVLAAVGVRSWRNGLALLLAIGGVAVLTDIRIVDEWLGFVFAFVNCALFMVYVTLGHRVANTGEGAVDRLGAAMLVAAVIATPHGIGDAAVSFAQPVLLLAGIGVGVCSSVVPYVIDQVTMARVRRTTFALMLSLLPAAATVIGLVVLHQLPTAADLAGVSLVILGVALHRTT
ncbi:EamA family transporter [Kibdelosporangium phytohabitans]|uniref:EamA domain-containing protein n=1 Tax=Kibdelosporangium phytohabitans TaxID=860235 RepID=A0A0N9I2D3_9PSEU|nr:hypothetical protein [Kibdelosporangium phytohabitans]ALG11827.1 hypothetical protein AOZ06_37555 [Kibdelosporangium phytohabitans]MBE1463244.1 inner membrane transporter RhtA [Kibdelosporangium phytohabitans]